MSLCVLVAVSEPSNGARYSSGATISVSWTASSSYDSDNLNVRMYRYGTSPREQVLVTTARGRDDRATLYTPSSLTGTYKTANAAGN